LAWGLLGLLIGISDFLRISLSSTGHIPIRFLLITTVLYAGIGGLAGLLAALLVRSTRIIFRGDDNENLFTHYLALGIGILLVIGFLSRPSQIIILRPFIRSPVIVLLIASILAVGWLLHILIYRIYRLGPQRWLKRRRISEIKLGARFTMVIFALILIVTLGYTLWTIIPSLYRDFPRQSTGHNGPLPNVLIITLDTTRRDHLSSYGYPMVTTPNIDRLVRDGVIYTNAISTSSWTLPSHSSLFTGLYPYEHGSHRMETQSPDQGTPQKIGINRLHDEHQTLAEILNDHGYRTGAIIGGAFLTSSFGVAQGFEVYNDHFSWDDFFLRSEWIQFYPVQKFSQLMRIPSHLLFPPNAQRRADLINQYAVRWLKSGDERPFFLFLNYFDPHSPYNPPSPFDRLFETDTLGMLRPPTSIAGKKKTMSQTFEYDPKFIRYQISQYDGEVAFMDHHIGKFIDYLKDVRLYDDTMIIITSDHGEFLGEHSRFGHGRTPLFEPLLQIPLIIKFPGGIRSGEVADEAIQLVDLMAVILSSLDLPIPDVVYRPPSLALDHEPHEVISEVYPKISTISEDTSSFEYVSSFRDSIFMEHLCFLTCTRRVIYVDSYKYILASCGREELYHLDSDPGEENNRAEKDNAIVRQGRLLLENWLASTKPYIKVEEDFIPDPALRTRLTALGYLQ
jgi:arylsulfatase A-like enzyme